MCGVPVNIKIKLVKYSLDSTVYVQFVPFACLNLIIMFYRRLGHQFHHGNDSKIGLKDGQVSYKNNLIRV